MQIFSWDVNFVSRSKWYDLRKKQILGLHCKCNASRCLKAYDKHVTLSLKLEMLRIATTFKYSVNEKCTKDDLR